MLSHEDEVTYHTNTALAYLYFAEKSAKRGEFNEAVVHATQAATHFKRAEKHQALATRPGSSVFDFCVECSTMGTTDNER